jgi:protein phosphatase
MSLRGKINFAELTDTGRVREHNEDAIGSNADIGLMVLADGMGGYNAGEVASGIAVQIVTQLASDGADREELNDVDPHSGMMRQSIILRDAVSRSNKVIYHAESDKLRGHGHDHRRLPVL